MALVKRGGKIRDKPSHKVLTGTKRDAEEWYGTGDRSLVKGQGQPQILFTGPPQSQETGRTV